MAATFSVKLYALLCGAHTYQKRVLTRIQEQSYDDWRRGEVNFGHTEHLPEAVRFLR